MRILVFGKVFFLCSFFTQICFGSQSLTEAEIFRKCYGQMVRMHLSEDDSRLISLKNGKLQASEVCSRLLSQANLNSNLRLQEINEENLAILRTFQTFHAGWFSAYDLVKFELDVGTSQIYDSSEMAYFLTIAMFGLGRKYESILSSNEIYSAVRMGGPSTHFLDTDQFGAYKRISDKSNWTVGKHRKGIWKPEFVEFGQLIGFKVNQRKFRVEYQESIGSPLHSAVPGQGLGPGGLLSSSSYLMLNSTVKSEGVPDGNITMHRNWSRAVFNDLLCRQMPVLEENDVKKFVQKDSPTSFRRLKKCMVCHATMDPMAGVVRNAIVTNPFLDGSEYSSKLVSVKDVSAPDKEMSPKQSDDLYFSRPPRGELRFRAYDGKLIEKPVENLKQLGRELVGVDDLYICAAKRYFEFFTGIQVPFRNFEAQPLKDEFSRKVLADVINWGRDLKKHQSLQGLIKEIIESDYYRSSGLQEQK